MLHVSPIRVRRLAAVAGVLLAVGLPREGRAQSVFDDWREPVVVELDVSGAKEGERPRAVDSGRIQLGPTESFTIQAEPLDQRGRRFPRDRFQMGVELDRRCHNRLSVSDTDKGAFRFSAGRSRGRCRVLLFVPGNLNLDYELEFEVTGIGATNYTRRQAEEIAQRLYRAVLQRDIDKSAVGTAVQEIQRGRVSNQVSSMIDSKEFAILRDKSQPSDLLEAFYLGLLKRTPDSAGINDYLRDIGRGRYREAVVNLVQSEEFEASLPTR